MIIVTGGAGFIGSCLVSYLNEMGHKDIWVVDSLGKSSKWQNLVGKVYLDYSEKNDFLRQVKEGCLDSMEIEAIFHLGACSTTTALDASYLMENNVFYTRDLALFAMERKIPFFYASSAATYGDGSLGFKDDVEKVEALRPRNMYGYSKNLFDLWAREKGWFDHITGFKFFNVFGPNETHKVGMTSIVYNAFHQIKETGEMKLFKSDHPEYQDGEQLRDFVYVKDIVKVLYWFFKHPEHKGLFNLGRGEPVSWKQITSAVFHAMKLPTNIKFIPMPDILKDKYQYYTCADMTKLRSIYSEPFTSIEESVLDYVTEYLNQDKVY